MKKNKNIGDLKKSNCGWKREAPSKWTGLLPGDGICVEICMPARARQVAVWRRKGQAEGTPSTKTERQEPSGHIRQSSFTLIFSSICGWIILGYLGDVLCIIKWPQLTGGSTPVSCSCNNQNVCGQCQTSPLGSKISQLRITVLDENIQVMCLEGNKIKPELSHPGLYHFRLQGLRDLCSLAYHRARIHTDPTLVCQNQGLHLSQGTRGYQCGFVPHSWCPTSACLQPFTPSATLSHVTRLSTACLQGLCLPVYPVN